MAFHVLTRLVAGAAVVAATAATRTIAVELKGDYKVEFVVNEASYTGTAKTTPAGKGAFTAKFDFTSPSPVTADGSGKTVGDSVTFEAKYQDTGRNCTGTVVGKGTAEKDGSKAAGTIAIQDSCDGEMAQASFTGTWSATGRFAIGRAKASGVNAAHWRGDIDDVYAFQRKLGSVEICQHANP